MFLIKKINKQNTMKGIIIGTILGTVLTGGIAFAAVTLTAKEIKYTPNNAYFTATNAEDALNELYKITENLGESNGDVHYITHGASIHASDAIVSITDYDKVLLVGWAFNNTTFATTTITPPTDSIIEYDSGQLMNRIASETVYYGFTQAMIVSGVKGKSVKFNLAYGGQYMVFGIS